MWLINTSTFELEQFQNERDLEYVILSHRWEDEEVSFQDIQHLNKARQLKGFDKLENFCREAREHGHDYGWADTCCINKDSSAELSEAINSMFRWYKNASECYVYLVDVTGSATDEDFKQQFTNSEWFERGWTLQELLAPQVIHFFNKAWIRLGSKTDLMMLIVSATHIEEEALRGRDLVEFSIAERMSWAARRRTTRTEDTAYSLMGIFNVNMAMLYGEGEKAFLRLQEEIIKHSDDHSIFAWSGVSSEGSGLLAAKPDCFSVSKGLEQREENLFSYNLSNKGLNIHLHVRPWGYRTYLAFLPCERPGFELVGIFLRKFSQEEYRRVQDNNGAELFIEQGLSSGNKKIATRLQNIYVRQDGLGSHIPKNLRKSNPPIYGIKIVVTSVEDITQELSTQGYWDPESNIAHLRPGQSGEVAIVEFSGKMKKLFPSICAAKMGLDWNSRPRCVLYERNEGRYPPWKHDRIEFTEPENSLFDRGARGVKGEYVYVYQINIRDFNMWAFELDDTSTATSFYLKNRPDSKRVRIEVQVSASRSDSRFVWVVHFIPRMEGLNWIKKAAELS